MEVSSLFEDLAYSIEIAGHEAGLQHYGTRMLLDTASLQREYREWFVPEEWHEPFFARAELSFVVDAALEARAQYTPEELAAALGLPAPDPDVEPPLLAVEVAVDFTLDLQNWGREQDDEDRWHNYVSGISAREKLEAGLRNLRGEVRHALQEEADDPHWDPPLDVRAETYVASGYGLVTKALHVEWVTSVDAELEDEEFAAQLAGTMRLVRAGILATRTFQDEIQRDFEEVQ